MTTIHVLNGPNLGRLGLREPHIYGETTLPELRSVCEQAAHKKGAEIVFRQTDSEADLVRFISEAGTSSVILNAAAFTHYSSDVAYACKRHRGRLVEVHISNPHSREPFRRHSVISQYAEAVIAGLGVQGYVVAIEFLLGRDA